MPDGRCLLRVVIPQTAEMGQAAGAIAGERSARGGTQRRAAAPAAGRYGPALFNESSAWASESTCLRRASISVRMARNSSATLTF